MTDRNNSNADETDIIVAYERGECRPVSDQDKARKEAAAAAGRYLKKRTEGPRTNGNAQSDIPDQTSEIGHASG